LAEQTVPGLAALKEEATALAEAFPTVGFWEDDMKYRDGH
jgi:hypothetical protein